MATVNNYLDCNGNQLSIGDHVVFEGIVTTLCSGIEGDVVIQGSLQDFPSGTHALLCVDQDPTIVTVPLVTLSSRVVRKG